MSPSARPRYPRTRAFNSTRRFEWSLLCTLALLLAAPLRAAPPPPTMVLEVGHSGHVNAIAYSRDGQTLATGGWESTTRVGTVRLWDVPTGQVKATLNGAQGFAFSPDGKTLATVTRPDYNGNFALRLWDVASG